MKKGEWERFPWNPILVLVVATLGTGAAGMAVSFLYLGSNKDQHVLAGAVGFIGGAILFAAGLLAIVLLSRSPHVGEKATLAIRFLWGFAPALVALASWPVLFFALGCFGLGMVPAILIYCTAWAWTTSKSAASDLAALLDWRDEDHVRAYPRNLQIALFGFQLFIILGSWPLFGFLLRLLGSMGHKVGWS